MFNADVMFFNHASIYLAKLETIASSLASSLYSPKLCPKVRKFRID